MPKKKPQKSLDELLEEALVKEDEQPYEVTGNWVWVKFDTALLNVTSSQKKLKQKKYSELGNIPVVDQGAKLIGGHTTQKDLQYDGELPVIIFGDHTRIVKFIDFAFVQGADGVKVLLPRQIFVPEFIYYFLKNLYIPGMGYRRHFKFLTDASFSLAPLPEQKRVVKKLSSMLGKLKEARELIREAKETFEERRASILNKAFTGELTKKWREENPDVEISLKEIEERKKKPYKIPAKWKWVKLKEIGEIITGTTPSKKRKDFYGDKFPLFKPTDLNEGYYVTQAADNLSELGIRATRVLPERSVMVTCIGATIGKTGFSRIRGATNQQINSIIADEEVLPEFIYFTAISPFFQRSILNNASATTLPILNKTRFGNLLFPLSPLPEQKEIVRILEKLLDHEDEARALIDMEEQIELLEKSILSKAFRGELGTNDPNDEPAIELLKRSLKNKVNVPQSR